MIFDKGRPIWRQIVREVKERIFRGDIEEELPTVRGLAEELGVNPNTVARAYRDMERDEIIKSRVGKGTWVAEGAREKLKTEMVESIVEDFVGRLNSLGLSIEDIKNLLEEIDDKNK